MTDMETRTGRKRTNPVVLALLGLLGAAVLAGAYYLFLVQRPFAQNQEMNRQLVEQTVGLANVQRGALDPRFKDANGDLVADAPGEAGEFIDPPTLTFSYVAEEPKAYKEAFADLTAHLAKAIGRPVEFVGYESPEEELRAMREGKLHIAGLNTGLVEIAVNLSGFVPLCCMASDDGTFTYQMELIVPADSAIQNEMQVKGHELVLTEPGSNSGFKAPLVILTKDKGLQPVRDFSIRYSQAHEQSIIGIARKEYQVAAVASDRLKRAIAEGIIAPNQYRTILKSQGFPTAAFGYVYNLKPELAAKVKAALLSFQWKGSSVAKQFEPSGQTKFIPIDYAKDWQTVRHVDEEIRGNHNLERILETATSQPSTAPAATQP